MGAGSGAARRKSVHLLDVDPDISFGEDKPLRALISRAASDRLLVVLSSCRLVESSQYDFEIGGRDGIDDHIMALEDTTTTSDQPHRYGWFYGAERDNLLLRYAQLVRQTASQMSCAEIVVKGEGVTALSALLLASYLGDITVLLERPELVAGESDVDQFRSFVRSQVNDEDPGQFIETSSDRMRLKEILSGCPEGLKIVLTSADGDGSHHGSSLLASDPRTTSYSGTAREWLASVVQATGDGQ